MQWLSFRYSARRFALWRMIFGGYLTYYYFRVLPFAVELYSDESPYKLSFNRFRFVGQRLFDVSATTATDIVLCAALGSLLFTLGILRRPMAILVWLLSAWMYNRNSYTLSPEMGIGNLTLFISAFIPDSSLKTQWEMPAWLYWATWASVAMIYTNSGISKLLTRDDAWRNGMAMYYILAGSNGRSGWYGNLFRGMPYFLSLVATYGTLVVELGSPFFALHPKTRRYWWLAILLMHVGILIFLSVEQLSLGMIMVQLFIFDEKWNDEPWIPGRLRRALGLKYKGPAPELGARPLGW